MFKKVHSADKLLNKLGFHVMLVIYTHYSFISKDKIQPQYPIRYLC